MRTKMESDLRLAAKLKALRREWGERAKQRKIQRSPQCQLQGDHLHVIGLQPSIRTCVFNCSWEWLIIHRHSRSQTRVFQSFGSSSIVLVVCAAHLPTPGSDYRARNDCNRFFVHILPVTPVQLHQRVTSSALRLFTLPCHVFCRVLDVWSCLYDHLVVI